MQPVDPSIPGLLRIHRHINVRGAKLRFRFKGKSGVRHDVDVEDARVAAVVRRCQDLPGEELFGYVDCEGEYRDVTSGDVNRYLQDITGQISEAVGNRLQQNEAPLVQRFDREPAPARGEDQRRVHKAHIPPRVTAWKLKARRKQHPAPFVQ